MTPLTPTSRFSHYPDSPMSELLRNAYTILRNTHDASSSFLSIFERTRERRRARGAPTDEEQDLLRAMFVFASSGLDSMTKQLIKDALGPVIESHKGAMGHFKTFIEKRLGKREVVDVKFLAEVLASKDPRDVLVAELVNELLSQSLQSKDQLLRGVSYFDIPSRLLANDLDALQKIFDARNQIVHEMDVDFAQPNRNRRPRSKGQMIQYTTELLRIGNVLLRAVDSKLAEGNNGQEE